MKRPCNRRMVTGEDISSGHMAHKRPLRDIKMAEKSLLKISKNNTAIILDEPL